MRPRTYHPPSRTGPGRALFQVAHALRPVPAAWGDATEAGHPYVLQGVSSIPFVDDGLLVYRRL